MNYKEHAILIIKNKDGKYLQYFDDRWNCYLFPNCKLTDNNHFMDIFKVLKDKFGFYIKSDDVVFCMEKIHTKFSESDQIMKTYKHYFYNVNNCDMVKLKNVNETISGISVKWMSFEEMKQNERIMQVNSDIVGFVEKIENTPKF